MFHYFKKAVKDFAAIFTNHYSKLIFWFVFATSVVLFFVHANDTFRRFLNHDVQQSVTIKQNNSLPLPVVTLQFDMYRTEAEETNISLINMQFDASIDGGDVPPWAYHETSLANQQSITVNSVDGSYLPNVNLTLDDVRKMWPLTTSLLNVYSAGININGYFNGTNFIEFWDNSGNMDVIQIYISSFDVDAPESSLGIAFFNLLPCEQLTISLSLQHYILLDRPASRCRDDYPESVARILKQPMTPNHFYNPVFSPNLPYDPDTCQILCATNYWLPKCGCYSHPASWKYAGEPENVSVCSDFGPNCTTATTPTVKPEKTAFQTILINYT